MNAVDLMPFTEGTAVAPVSQYAMSDTARAKLVAAVTTATRRLRQFGFAKIVDLEMLFQASIGALRREVVSVASFDADFRLVGFDPISIGTANCVSVGRVELVAPCVVRDACLAVIGHNHPSGCSVPSDADISTCVIDKRLLATVGVGLLDCLIVTQKQVVSMRERDLPQGLWDGGNRSRGPTDEPVAAKFAGRIEAAAPTDADAQTYADARDVLVGLDPFRPMLRPEWCAGELRRWLRNSGPFVLAALAVDSDGREIERAVLVESGQSAESMIVKVDRFAIRTFAGSVIVGVRSGALSPELLHLQAYALRVALAALDIELIDVLLISDGHAESLRERGTLDVPPGSV